MLDAVLFVALPYTALFSLVVGSVLRYRSNPFSYSALSSQFLESRTLWWSSVAWHLGITLILLGHLAALLAPGLWRSLTASPAFLAAVESAGVAAALLAIGGLAALLLRRITSARLQLVTSTMDLVVLALLLQQVVFGLGVALSHRWGAAWSTVTTTPYLWGILTLRPDPALVADLPALVKMHLAGAWLIFLLLPFSRLVHVFSVPFAYLVRPPIKVLWTNPRRLAHPTQQPAVVRSRRDFVLGSLGVAGAGVLLSIGVLDRLLRYFNGLNLNAHDEAMLLDKRLKRLNMTAEERSLELERMRSERILVASLAELQPGKGKYFIDYRMRPALAFLGTDGLPLLISAKCTHLGCTVGSEVDARGRILCPCHMSFFDVKTGVPNDGSPAKDPLPHLGWALVDEDGAQLTRRTPDGTTTGVRDPAALAGCSVYILKRFETEVA
jgi:nitrate reductase gamma subunit